MSGGLTVTGRRPPGGGWPPRSESLMKRRPRKARAVHRLRVAGIDRHSLESLWLELRRMGRAYGLEIDIRIERTAVRRSA